MAYHPLARRNKGPNSGSDCQPTRRASSARIATKGTGVENFHIQDPAIEFRHFSDADILRQLGYSAYDECKSQGHLPYHRQAWSL